MSQVFRYVSAVSAATSVTTAQHSGQESARASTQEYCPACNYGDNYYGDQVCRPTARR